MRSARTTQAIGSVFVVIGVFTALAGDYLFSGVCVTLGLAFLLLERPRQDEPGAGKGRPRGPLSARNRASIVAMLASLGLFAAVIFSDFRS
jgi:hypothetical protein